MIACYAFSQVPRGRGRFVRDLRVRWALEEAEIPHCMRLVGTRPGDLKPSEYHALQSFGQVPALEHGELTLFASGAVVLYLGERSPKLLPRQQPERARAAVDVYATCSVCFPIGRADTSSSSLRHSGAKLSSRKKLREGSPTIPSASSRCPTHPDIHARIADLSATCL